MAHKHLRELLREDQEPFVLQSYIDERRCQLKKWTPRTQLQVKRPRPISENSSFPGSLCKSACFFSFHDSPDARRSPLFDFASPAKSPCRNSNTLFIHIPSRTAAVLLEAALRIQKQSSSSKFKSPNKSLGFGFFGSILKRISLRKRNRKREIKGEEVRVSVKDILRWDSSDGRKICQDDDRLENREPMEVLDYNRVSEMGFSCSCNSRLSSAWSESNEEKSEDLETSTSSRSEASEAMEFIVDERKNGECNSCEKAFCSSSFRFMLPKSPSSSRRTPEFQSPATSPSRHRKEVSRCEQGSLNCVGKDYEEEKEQCSPVSVLDPLFGEDDDNDDDDDDDGKNQDEEMGEGFELERSFAIVQKAKQQLLHKLRRFERFAELDPIELEKSLMEEEDDDDENDDSKNFTDEECDDDKEPVLSNNEKNDNGFDKEILSRLGFSYVRRLPQDMKRLVIDLISEEEREAAVSHDREVVVKGVCKQLESWKEVNSNTIDMMVELDFRREGDEWRRHQEQVQDAATEIEFAIFGFLVQELSDELVHF